MNFVLFGRNLLHAYRVLNPVEDEVINPALNIEEVNMDASADSWTYVRSNSDML